MPDYARNIGWMDWSIPVTYFVAVVLTGVWFARRQRSAENYYIADQTVPAWAAGISLFANSITAVTLLAYPGHGFAGDWTRLVPGLMLLAAAVCITSFTIPFYRRVLKISAYEYLQQRFGYPARAYAGFVYISIQVFRMGFVLFLTSKAIHAMTDWNVQAVILASGLITIVYTTLGGVQAVIWTDVLQSSMLLIGGLFCMGFVLFSPAGGASEVVAIAWNAGKFKLADISLDLTQTSIVVMMVFGFVQYNDNYLTSQVCVQRYLSVPTTRKAQLSVWFNSAICISTWTFFLFLGTLLFAYYQIYPQRLPESIAADQASVLPYFVATHFPTGALGLFLALLCAAGVSSLDAAMNALSLTTLEDFVLRRYPNLSNRRQVVVGRLASCFWGLAGTVLAMSMIRVEAALDFSMMMFSILAGGVFGMFLLGLFTTRAHLRGLYFGLLAGIGVTLWSSLGKLAEAGLPVPYWLPVFPFHALLTGTCASGALFVVGYLASLVLSKPDEAQIEKKEA